MQFRLRNGENFPIRTYLTWVEQRLGIACHDQRPFSVVGHASRHSEYGLWISSTFCTACEDWISIGVGWLSTIYTFSSKICHIIIKFKSQYRYKSHDPRYFKDVTCLILNYICGKLMARKQNSSHSKSTLMCKRVSMCYSSRAIRDLKQGRWDAIGEILVIASPSLSCVVCPFANSACFVESL